MTIQQEKGQPCVNMTALPLEQTFDEKCQKHNRANIQLNGQKYTEHVRNLSGYSGRPTHKGKTKDVHGNGLTARYVVGRVGFSSADALIPTPANEAGPSGIHLASRSSIMRAADFPSPLATDETQQWALGSASFYAIRYVNASQAGAA